MRQHLFPLIAVPVLFGSSFLAQCSAGGGRNTSTSTTSQGDSSTTTQINFDSGTGPLDIGAIDSPIVQGDTGGADPVPPKTDGLTGPLVVTCQSTSLTVDPSAASPTPATTTCTVQGTVNGTLQTLTGASVWLHTDDPNGIESASTFQVSGGTFTSVLPGVFTIMAIATDGSGNEIDSNQVKITVAATAPVSVDFGGGAPVTTTAGAGHIIYPLNNSIMPVGFPLDFHLDTAGTKGQVTFTSAQSKLNLTLTAACTAPLLGGCRLSLYDSTTGSTKNTQVWNLLAAASEEGPLTITGAVDGKATVSTTASWTFVAPTGAVFFWSIIRKPAGQVNNALVMQYDMSNPQNIALPFYQSDLLNTYLPTEYTPCSLIATGSTGCETSAGTYPSQATTTNPAAIAQWQVCFGCHAITQDGKKVGLSFGGASQNDWRGYGIVNVDDNRDFSVVSTVLTPVPAGTITATSGDKPTFSSFSPDGTSVLNEFAGGHIELRDSTTLATKHADLFTTDTGELVSLPFWSADGSEIAFVSWRTSDSNTTASNGPEATPGTDVSDGDLVRGGQIWIAGSDGTDVTGTARLLVPRQGSGATGLTLTNTYPGISDDSQWVVFNENKCSGPSTGNTIAQPNDAYYGADSCDGYDDPSAQLKLITTDPEYTSGAIYLTNANSGTDMDYTNSWARFSPSHGRFRGMQLYWVVYSSRRPFGLELAGSTNGTSHPQLWLSALVMDADAQPISDPSYPPFYMPNQNGATATTANPSGDANPTGNHIPQWVKTYVPVVKVTVQ